MSHQNKTTSFLKKPETVTSGESKENVDKRKNPGESMKEVAGPSRDIIPKKKMKVVIYNGNEIVSEFETPPTSIVNPEFDVTFTNSQGKKVKLDKNKSKQPITSQLIAAREAIKMRIGYGMKEEETDEKLMNDPRFKEAMKKLMKNPITCIYKDNTVTVIWNEKEQMLGYNDGKVHEDNPGGRRKWKCKVAKCFLNAESLPRKYCRSHGPKQNYIIRDLTSTTLGFVTPPSKDKSYSTSDLTKYLQTSTAKTLNPSLYNHFQPHDANAKIKIDYSWDLAAEKVIGGEGSSHKLVALSLMVMLHNSVCDDEDKIHLINQEIVFSRDVDVYEADFFPKLLAVLTANGFIFRPTHEAKSTSVVPGSLLAKVSYKNLPHVYRARDEDDGRIYVGVKWANVLKNKAEGSASHKNNKKTALTDFPDDKKSRMYQQQHSMIDDVKGLKQEKDLNPTQKPILEEMKVGAKKKESLAQLCCIIAKMLGVKISNNPTKLLFQKYAHYDNAFDLSLFKDFFGYMFGCGVELEIPKLVKDGSGKVLLKLF